MISFAFSAEAASLEGADHYQIGRVFRAIAVPDFHDVLLVWWWSSAKAAMNPSRPMATPSLS
jgi:hypothetical protein